MIPLKLIEIAHAIGAQPRDSARSITVSGVATDSRTIRAGELFLAIAGENFDGHAFVGDALARGAVAAVIASAKAASVRANLPPSIREGAALIEVDHPVAALGRLAAHHRRLLRAIVIAVVGSNGKTTTKAMLDHLLSGRLRGRASPKSFNNAIGVPHTLLSAEAADEYVVVEIGTNAPGEVAALAEMARPDIAVLTSIGEEHLEGLSDLAGVAAEECSIFAALGKSGIAVVNVDSPLVRPHLPATGTLVVTTGTDDDADLRVATARYEAPWLEFELAPQARSAWRRRSEFSASAIDSLGRMLGFAPMDFRHSGFDSGRGRATYRLPMPGIHNASNAAAAIVVARWFGFERAEIATRLESFVPPPMRMEVLALNGVTVINDAYNSNPRSAIAAIETLEQLACRGRRIAVFGEMREMGVQSEMMHRRVAERLARSRVDRVILLEPAASWMRECIQRPAGQTASHASASADGRAVPDVETVSDVRQCATRLAELVADGDVVLLKASRAVGLERVIETLRQRSPATAVA